MKKLICTIALAASVAAGACVGYESKTTAPTTTVPGAAGVEALVGTWTSASTNIIPSPSTCTDFKWTPSQQSATSATGAFSASCAGDLKVSGTAAGTLSGTTITWNAQASATTPQISSCAIALTGTAELGVSSIRIPYTGQTCLGPVSGVEVLNKK
jgi:hypothetical protein